MGQYALVAPDEVFSRLDHLDIQGDDKATAGVRIGDLLRGRCVSVVLETEYIDRDYTAAYAALYNRFFRPPERFCSRYHFFGRQVTEEEIVSGIAPSEYLGFIVVWPTDPEIIGRSALAPPPDLGPGHLIVTEIRAHLHGTPFPIEAAPYATKDFGVAACATISTWLATELLSAAWGLPRTSTARITAEAVADADDAGRNLPQRFGFTPGGMARALARIGYDPFVYDLLRSVAWHPTGTLYGYVSSNIPVILIVDLGGGAVHAVLVVGFEYDESRVTEGRSLSHGVTSFIVHDDRYGPYGRMRVENDDGHYLTVVFEYPEGMESESCVIQALVVPLPRGVSTISHDAHLFGRRWARDTVDFFGEPYRLTEKTYLVESNDLKTQASGWPQVLRDDLRQTALPHWVWVTECHELPLGGPPVAVAVTDPTVLRDATRRMLWCHYRGTLLTPQGEPSAAILEEDLAASLSAE